MTGTEALTELLAQHAMLRAIIERCEQLADDVDAGRDASEPLAREIVRLRVAFDRHNQAEERELRPILREADASGDVRIDRMVADHIDEHRAMYRRFALEPIAELRDTLALLREHLVAEERMFLSGRVARDDASS